MQGDWTLPDPTIEQFISKYGRAGIPFDLVIGPSAPQGILLPELLTIQSIQTAIENASKNQTLGNSI